MVQHWVDVLVVADANGVELRRIRSGPERSDGSGSVLEGEQLLGRLHPEDRKSFLPIWQSVVGVEGASAEFEVRVRHVTEPERWQLASLICVGLAERGDGAVAAIAASVTELVAPHLDDITSDGFPLTELAPVALAMSENARLRATFEHSQLGIALVSFGGKFADVNPAFCNLTGYDQSELVGRTMLTVTHPDDRALCEHYIGQLASGERDSFRMEKRYLHRDGSVVWADTHVAAVQDLKGRTTHFVANTIDISERVRIEDSLRTENEELVHRATHDYLTGLPNRLLLEDHLAVVTDGGEEGVYALMGDLDDFKAINDVHGHRVGDAVLIEVARRLRAYAREGDLVARVGGDEFVVLARIGDDPTVVERLGDRLVDAVRRPIEVGSLTVTVGISIGITLIRGDVDVADSLNLADAAAYEVKRHGGGSLLKSA